MTSGASFPPSNSKPPQPCDSNTQNSSTSTTGGTQTDNKPANDNLPDILAPLILERALIDCVYIYFKHALGFYNHIKPLDCQMNLIAKERQAILEWLESVQFADICSYLKYDYDITKTTMLNAMQHPKTAHRIAALYDIRVPDYKTTVVSILLLASLLLSMVPGMASSLPSPTTQAAKTLDPVLDIYLTQQPKIPENTYVPQKGSVSIVKADGSVVVVSQLKTLIAKKDTKVPIMTPSSANIQYYKVTAYTYLTKDGTKVDYPFKAKGVKNTIPSPFLAQAKVYAKKLSIFQPFISAAGSFAQILNLAFKK
jgi:hypothetical protein